MLDPTPMNREEIDDANAMFDDQIRYFTDLFARRRRDPSDDLISALLHVEDEAGGLTHDELLANVWLLFAAGHETTKHLIGNGLLALYRNPRELERLRADRSSVPSAVAELLRYDPSVQYVGRTAYEDVPVGDIVVERDQPVLCLVERETAIQLCSTIQTGLMSAGRMSDRCRSEAAYTTAWALNSLKSKDRKPSWGFSAACPAWCWKISTDHHGSSTSPSVV